MLKDGKPFLAIGTPGGDSQDQQILLVLLNIIDFGMDVQAAIEAPRVNSLHPVSSFDNHRPQPGVLEAEASLGPDRLDGARRRAVTCSASSLLTASRPAWSRRGSTPSADVSGEAPISAASAPSWPGSRSSMDIPFIKHTLENGLDVLIHEDHGVPIVAVNVWYHVGSKNEVPGRTGFAHLFEHLMFEGSQHYDRGYFHPLQEAGAALNGSTNADRTNYWEVVPTNALDLALWMESDRMGYLLPALTDAKFENQRDVVLNERRQNYENRPYGMAGMAIVAALYPPDHPYHWLTIGESDDIRAADIDEVRAFFQRYYHPRNASLALAGDIDPEVAMRLAERYFAEIPGAPRPARVSPSPATPPDRRDAAGARGSRRAPASLHRLALAGALR